ncbi:MAG: hypothetical protein H6598_00830 [Flavobacteriales bacterium]|nr:hypothetical protein [Flavobacteriales bacterium]
MNFKGLILGLLLICNLSTYADSWDNLTKEQAENTVAFLEKNPFIFDYCDCCDQNGVVSLLRITSMEIVTCDWDNNYFSIKYQAELVSNFVSDANGVDISKKVTLTDEETATSGVISMNYNWGFNKDNMNINPLVSMINYDVYGTDYKPCLNAFSLPSPKLVGNKHYKKWFKKL